MELSKKIFLDFLFDSKALKFGSDFKLKNDRLSPYFINMGELDTGIALKKLGEAYSSQIQASGKNFDILFGPSYKGIPIVVATAMSLSEKGIDTAISFNRKEPKKHGEGGQGNNSQKSLIVGRILKDNDRVLLLDDVLTTAETKYELINLIKSLASSVEIVAIFIGVDRQEIGIDGKNAIEELTKTTGIPIISVINSYDIYTYLQSRNEIEPAILHKIETYMNVYGSDSLKENLGKIPEQTIIKNTNTIIPACDVATIEEFEALVKETGDIEKVGGYKLGFELALRYGLPELVSRARKYTNKSLIYDHQKAGTDIPDKGKEFARVCKESGIDTVILFPQAGPETERAWIYFAIEQGLNVIVGGIMSHKAYTMREGGFISDEGAFEIYRIAARIGINNFVVPATKLDVIQKVNEIVEHEGVSPTYYSPGFYTQGGNVDEVKKILGERIHVIVGREINKAKDKRQAVLDITKRLV